MNITFFRQPQTINFGTRHYEEFLDDLKEPYEDEIIPEYEELGLDLVQPSSDPFREDELFDRRKGDIVDYYYRCYGNEDDIPLNDDIRLRRAPKECRQANFEVEPRYALPANYYLNNLAKDIYTSENAYQREKESFQTRLNQGFSKKEVSEIYHSSLVNKSEDLKTMDYKLAKVGFELLKSGKTLKDTTKLMEDSKIKYADGSSRFKQELCDFLIQYPNSRKVAVEETKHGERLRTDIIPYYPMIKEYCNDETEATLIIKASMAGHQNNQKVDEKLLHTCEDLIKEGYAPKTAAKIVNGSKMKDENNLLKFNNDLFEFLKKYPNDRTIVVTDKGADECLQWDIMDTYDRLNQVCSEKKDFKEIVNACKIDRRGKKPLDKNAVNVCIKLLENGEYTPKTLELIEDSKLQYKNGDTRFDEDLFNFITKYPEGREIVIERANGREHFRPDRASAYEEINKVCDKVYTISDIIEDCELSKTYKKKVSPELTNLAVKLYTLNDDWDSRHTAIMDKVKRHFGTGTTCINDSRYELAKTMAENGNYGIHSIYSVVVLNLKNPELLK